MTPTDRAALLFRALSTASDWPLQRVFSSWIPGGQPLLSRGNRHWQSGVLARVLEYIDANLHRPIYLIEMANAAGLSRMRFATQFRAATGFSPHEYVLRQKVNRGRDLLRNPSVSLVDVALQLGFRSQSHFSTVFKKHVGDSPARWRTLILDRLSVYPNASL